jgi:hypothetical protein
LCYLQIVITFLSNWNLLKNSSTQEAKDQKFLHPDSPLQFLRMTASNKKADGPQIQAIRRVNHEWNATNLFHIIQNLLHRKKRSHNLCDKWPAFHLTACESLDEKILTHCGRVTQICVFTLQRCKTGDANLRFLTSAWFPARSRRNYAIHGACLRMVLLTDVYRNVTSLWINDLW